MPDEWLGLDDDDLLVHIFELLDVLTGHRHAILSKQMQRVCTRALEHQLSLNPEQAVVFESAMRGHNVFLSGGAGTCP